MNKTPCEVLRDCYHFPSDRVHSAWGFGWDATHHHGITPLHPYFDSIRYLFTLYILDGCRDVQLLVGIELLKGKHRHRARHGAPEYERAARVLIDNNPIAMLRAYEALCLCCKR